MENINSCIFDKGFIERKFISEGIMRYKFFLSEQDRKDGKIIFEFDMINTTVNSKELFRNLAIIYRDIVWACKGTVNKYIIVRVFDGYDIQRCIRTIEILLENDELTTSEVPIFFILEKSKRDIFYTWVTRLLKEGYVDANALVNFEHSFVMVKTDKHILKSMYNHVYSKLL